MTAHEAGRIAQLVLNRARTKRRTFAVFVVAARVCIVRAHGERYERALSRFPAGLAGVYDWKTKPERICMDLVEIAREQNVRIAA